MVNLSEQHLLLVGVGTELFVGRDELFLAQPELLETVEQLAVLLVNLGDRIGAAHSCQTTGSLLSLGAQTLRLDTAADPLGHDDARAVGPASKPKIVHKPPSPRYPAPAVAPGLAST